MSALAGRNFLWGLGLWVPVILLAGCLHAPAAVTGGGGVLKPPPTVAGTEPIIIALNLVAWLGIVAAAGALVASAWLPVPKATAGTLVLAAVGAWALKILLVKLWWLVLIVAIVGVGAFVWHWIAATDLHMQGRKGWLVWWIERRLKKDLNNDGQIGQPQ